MTDQPIVHAAVSGERRLAAADLWRIPRVGAPRCSPCATRLVVPVTTWPDGEGTGLTRLWLVHTDGSETRPLTADHASAGLPAWSPDGGSLAYTVKPRGDANAKPQLHLMRFAGGEPECLTDFPLGVSDVRWLPDGSGLVLASKLIVGNATVAATRAELAQREEEPVKAHATEQRLFRFWDQWLTDGEVPHFFHLNLASRECRDLTPDSTAWLDFMSPSGQFDVAPDGSEIVFAGLVVNAQLNEIDSRIFRVRLCGGDVECLTPDLPADAIRPRYAPDGQSIVYGRNEDRHFYADRARLYRFDRDTESHQPWCDGWDLAPAQWEYAPDGQLVLVAEQAARTHLYALSPDEQTPRLVARGGRIATPTVAQDASAYFTRQSIQQPPEIYRCPWADSQPDRVTRFTEDALSGVALGEVRELQCVGAEGQSVQSFVVFPPDHDSRSPAPLVNIVHGGPHGIWGDEFHFRWNPHVMTAPGYVAALPNFQGSTSWGQDFAQCIQGQWAERPFADVMAVTDRLIDLGIADPHRLAAAGGSYGGYLVAWIAGHTDRFRCLINHAGVYNTLSMYASDATWGRERCFGGAPWDNIEAIDRYNPARFTADMTTPMLVIHGEKDYRVPVTQGLECYGVLQAKGVPARLLHFPDENHWVLKPHNSIRWYREFLDWLDRWLT